MNNVIRVLWLSNVAFVSNEMKATGTWITSMASALQDYDPNVVIYNVTVGQVNDVEYNEVGRIKQWILPNEGKMVPSKRLKKELFDIVALTSPQIIHIWGTEFFWGIVDFKETFPNIPVLLDIQGFIGSVYENYLGGLSRGEILKCFSIKELIRPRSFVLSYKKYYGRIAKREIDIIKKMKYISVQSEWSRACVSSVNKNCCFFDTGIALRKAFYDSKTWTSENVKKHIIFTTASLLSPYKGLHTLLKAFIIVLKQYPDAKLYIASPISSGIRKGGYERFIESLIKKNKLEANVVFLGALETYELINAYLNCSVFVNPSYVESYSLVVAEAMRLGIPTIVSFAGAMGELGHNNESILYFPKGDIRMCAFQISKVLGSVDVADNLSFNAKRISQGRNNLQEVVSKQISIYEKIIEES